METQSLWRKVDGKKVINQFGKPIQTSSIITVVKIELYIIKYLQLPSLQW